MRQVEQLRVSDIRMLPGRRGLNPDAVERIAESMKSIGLRTPITVRIVDGFQDHDGEIVDGQPILVTGRHRLEAARKLGWEQLECFIFDTDDEIAAQLWEISENLHRAELSTLERSEQIAEWVRLSEERELQSVQVEPIESKREDGRGHRPEGGIRAASRELGIQRNKVMRAVKIAGLSDDAKEAAREAGLDDNQSALERVARASDQVAEIEAIKTEKINKPRQEVPQQTRQWTPEDEASYAELLDAYQKSTPAARVQFWREHGSKAA